MNAPKKPNRAISAVSAASPAPAKLPAPAPAPPPETTAASQRKPRADGIESRRTILEAAAALATTHGLDGLSIGDLAQHIGMSKSGLYAHFKSKEELELATIETAAEIFENAVIAKIPEAMRGLARIRALSEAFLEHLAERVFPGGCFFAAVAVQLAPHPGRARDRVMQLNWAWGGQFARALGEARDDGELPPEVDLEQLAFEITAMLFRANFAWVLSANRQTLEQARIGLTHVLDRVTLKSRPAERGKRSSK
jgi:AcrR family transcriptional regulator